MKKTIKIALLTSLIIFAGILALTACSSSSKGLAYKINDDEKTCTIIDIGTCTATDIKIPKKIDGYKVTAIGEGAFFECHNLTSIKLSKNIAIIKESAFRGCSSLAKITIPDSVTAIGDNAFYECNALTSIALGKAVMTIGTRAFHSCSALTKVA